VTLVGRAKLGGKESIVVSAVGNLMRIKDTLAIVEDVRSRYERNVRQVDNELRKKFAPPALLATSSENVCRVIEKARLLEIGAGVVKWTRLGGGSQFVSAWIRYDQRKQGFL
jgi:hypothetical protein